MKTYSIKYHFRQMDSTPRVATLTEDARYTVNQIGSIFATRMDCRYLVIDEIVAEWAECDSVTLKPIQN